MELVLPAPNPDGSSIKPLLMPSSSPIPPSTSVDQISRDASLSDIEMTSTAEKALTKYNWSGNVRELSNVLERVLSTLEGETINLHDLPFYLYQNDKELKGHDRASLRNIQTRAEKDAIRYALESANYNKAKASELLGIHRTLLYKKMKRYGLPLKKESE